MNNDKITLVPGKLYRVISPFEVLPPTVSDKPDSRIPNYQVAWLTVTGSILMFIKSEEITLNNEEKEERLYFLDQGGMLIRTLPRSFFLFEKRQHYYMFLDIIKEKFIEEVDLDDDDSCFVYESYSDELKGK